MNCITQWFCCCSKDESSHNQKQTSSKSNNTTSIALSSIGTNSSSPSKLNKYSIGRNRRSSDENSTAFKSTSKSLLIFSRKNSDSSSTAQAFIETQAFHNTSEMLINSSHHLPVAHVEPSNENSSLSSLDISQSDPQEQSQPLASSKVISKSQIPGTRTLDEILQEAGGPKELQVNIDYNIPNNPSH